MNTSHNNKKTRPRILWLLTSGIFLLVSFGFTVVVGFAQESNDGLPIIDYWPWQDMPSTKASATIFIEAPTPTPDDIEARKLPLAIPPVIPTVEIIDTSPNDSRVDKYEILVRRAESNQEIVLLMAANADLEKILDAYTNKNESALTEALKAYLKEGDKIIAIAPPRGFGGIRPTATSFP